MSRRVGFIVALAIVTAGALALRLPSLSVRPMHADESVHAFKFAQIWKHGTYRYDPNEFHGPTLYYATLPVVWLKGRASFAATTESDYRLVTVLFGAGIGLLVLLLSDGIGRRAATMAALLIALSPAFVFYSRYYIQETLLAFFTLALIGCLWRYHRSPGRGWAVGAGICAGMMIGTKETAVVAFFAAAAAFGILSVVRRAGFATRTPRLPETGAAGSLDAPTNRRAGGTGHGLLRHVVLAVAAAALTAALFLSGFLTHPVGIIDGFRAFTPWVGRAGGTGLHKHPWSYYLGILAYTHRAQGPVWTEALILGLAVVGGVASFTRWSARLPESGRSLARFLVLYTVILTVAYSVIPYKTPWCVLSFLTGMALLGGIGASALFDWLPGRLPRAALVLVLAAGATQLGWQAYRTSFLFSTDNRNPYVYAQTVPDVIDFQKRIEQLAESGPERMKTVVQIVSADGYYWPMPWYLRRLESIGYYTSVPPPPYASIVIASPQFDDELTKKLDPTHLMTGYYGLRPGAVYEVWVSMDLWKLYLAAHPHKPED